MTNPKKPQITAFHARLRRWYAARGRRDLPWRNTDNPYHIWVSEVMLQQTQVKTVLERYYHPFLEQFPSIESLAHAPRDTVMKAWEGLGYYSRAANLQKAAQEVVKCEWWLVSRENNTTPLTIHTSQLTTLPGIGRNTAHAILAFAYHQPVAVMESNVKRVLCRMFALERPSDAELWELAQSLVDARHPFDYNQAMMDVGAMVCTKSNPTCATCPASMLCKGKATPLAYPAPKPKKITPVRKRVIIAWRNARGQYHLTQREDKFLNGLYGFAEYEKKPKGNTLTSIGNVTQTYSHFQLEAEVWVGHYSPSTRRGEGIDNQFYALNEAAALPLSRADAKVLKLLEAYEARLGKQARRKK